MDELREYMLLSDMISKHCDQESKVTSALDISAKLKKIVSDPSNKEKMTGVRIYKLKSPNLPDEIKQEGVIKLRLYMRNDGAMFLGVSYKNGQEKLYLVVEDQLGLKKFFSVIS